MITLIVGTNRPKSNTRLVARQVSEFYNQLKVPLHVLDLAELPPEIFHTSSYAEKPKSFQPFADAILKADGLHVVTPEYNRGYPGHLKNALDALYQAWNYKPVAFVSYGGAAGGSRAVTQLGHVALELKMVPLRDEVNLSLIGLLVDGRGYTTAEIYGKKAQALLNELKFWAELLRTGREQHPR